MSSEQWKEDGLCYECRKRSYCGTECEAHRKTIRKELSALIAKKMDEKTNGAYSKVMAYADPRRNK